MEEEVKEEWRPVVGFEGLYEVSNLGRVKSVQRIAYGSYRKRVVPERIMALHYARGGYLRTSLHKDGEMRTFAIHRLVAEAFIPNPENLPQVNHKNEVKDDNRASNLEWCSLDYNVHYGTGIERRSKTQVNGPCAVPVLQIDPSTMEIIKEWPSMAEAERNGFSHGCVSNCCKNRYLREGNNVYHGFIWRYKEGGHPREDAAPQ